MDLTKNSDSDNDTMLISNPYEYKNKIEISDHVCADNNKCVYGRNGYWLLDKNVYVSFTIHADIRSSNNSTISNSPSKHDNGNGNGVDANCQIEPVIV
jgi:hypothetical protein